MSTVDSRKNFIEELCKYFMNFLQTGFKSTQYPKRYVRLTNEKNFKIGVDLAKYEKDYLNELEKFKNGRSTYNLDIND